MATTREDVTSNKTQGGVLKRRRGVGKERESERGKGVKNGNSRISNFIQQGFRKSNGTGSALFFPHIFFSSFSPRKKYAVDSESRRTKKKTQLFFMVFIPPQL